MERLNEQQRAKLAQDLPREAVKTLPGKKDRDGSSIGYVDGHYIVTRLNEVFGFEGWELSYGALSILDGDRPVVHVPTTLKAGGVTRADIGVGLAATKSPDSMETAIKGAFTDGLKRCARTWGASFGLALYDKDKDSRAVGWSFEVQEVIAAWDRVTDAASYDEARKVAAKAWADLAADERTAVRHAQERAAARVPDRDASAPANTTTPAPAPKLSPAVQTACDRIAVALSSRTVVAAILACDARGTAAAPLDAAVAARRAAGVDLGDVEATLARARTVTATPAQWEQSAAALAAFDGAADAAALNAARKAHAAAIVALPEALRSGVKSAADARAAALGAPTAASALLARAKAAKTTDELTKLHTELTAAVEGRRIATKAEVTAITDVLNARAEELAERAAMAAA